MWSCFASQQAAEKAIKSLFLKLQMEAWGHTLIVLLGNLPLDYRPSQDLLDYARVLDKHYIPTRYPNGFDSGAPTDFYTLKEAEGSCTYAKALLEFCKGHIGE
ncbi:MAG: HEPN domain-containing protein [Anaerolineales bacterium]|nr:HEPN domain-containing protein [Anaerolineales bacterium]